MPVPTPPARSAVSQSISPVRPPTTTQATTTTVANTNTVPDVSGMMRKDASNTLQADGYNPSFSAANCPTPNTTVQSTNPPAGTSAPKGSTVFLNC